MIPNFDKLIQRLENIQLVFCSLYRGDHVFTVCLSTSSHAGERVFTWLPCTFLCMLHGNFHVTKAYLFTVSKRYGKVNILLKNTKLGSAVVYPPVINPGASSCAHSTYSTS